MKRLSVLVFLSWLLWSGSLLARVTGLEIYGRNVFIEESFPVSPGQNRLPLKALVKTPNLRVEARGTAVLSLATEEGEPGGPLAEKLRELKKKREDLLLKEEACKNKLSLLTKAVEGKNGLPDPALLREYFTLNDDLLAELEKTRAQRRKLEEEIRKIESLLPPGKVSVLLVNVDRAGTLSVRYPAANIVRVDESYRLELLTLKKSVRLTGQAVVTQHSGEDWSGVTLTFHPRARGTSPLSPPPFQPWIVDLPPVRKGIAGQSLKEKALSVIPRREEAPGLVWERIVVENVVLPCGRGVVVPLARKTLQTKAVLIEVPVYALAEGFFRADVLPRQSFPRARAAYFLDGTYVGEGNFGPLLPGKESRLYFGEALLLEVERKTLKDTSGHPFFARGRETIEKEFLTSLTNHYQQAFDVELVDALPIAKKKKTKIEVSAEPPWQEKEPDGRTVWRFHLAPGEKATVHLKIRINRDRSP